LLRCSIGGKPSGGYSHARGRFLLDIYDPAMTNSPRRPLRSRLAGKRILICLGAGGVGKTTTAAALALGLAAEGRKVAVVTIDPARRLASALGLERLSSEPQRIEPARLEDAGLAVRGELWAMVLDAKRTFDEIVSRLEPDEAAREEILGNPVYRELSTAVAGSHELSAIAKLHELYEEHDFDVIVLDTPPSRNALDFLSAPTRLLGFLEGRALQVFLAPGGLTARLFGRGTALVFSIFARVTGVDMLGELSRFFRSLSGVIDGFGDRTRAVAALLRDPQTGFLIITSPEPEPAREALFLAARLAEAGMPSPELVVNRFHEDGLGERSPDEVTAMLAGELGPELAGRVARNLADFDVLARRDRQTVEALAAEIGAGAPTLVPHLDGEVQDLLGLSEVAEHLLG
jgi:anion-transporting  ArsA/GET3 family ATPase